MSSFLINMRRKLFWHVSICLILFLAVSCVVNPVTGNRELAFMSESQEISIGAEFNRIRVLVS